MIQMSCGLNDLLERQSSFLTWYFMVTFPAVIESGSQATLCTSLLKPNETLQLTVYLVHDNQNRTLLQERVEEEFHRCSQFKVLSKGAIVHHGYEKVEVKESKKLIEGKVSFRLSVDAGLAPVVQVLVYCVLPSENVIATSKNFNVEKCLRNKVSLQFSPTEAVPGEENTLQLSAQPGSLCGLSAVDQSVFIMEPGKRLNADEVFNLLPVKSVSGYKHEVEDDQKCLHVRPRQDVRIYHTYSTIKGVGLKMATNLAVRNPECLRYRRPKYPRRFVFKAKTVMGSPPESESEPIETVRKYFPETWIWQLAEVGDSGSAQVSVTVPDTITTWEADAFCLSSEGLGVAPPAQLRVFQPFFLELSLPYSIIRGEEFELKATVFNYLSKCIMVKVTPAPSSHYALKASSDGEYSSCLCANGRKTFKWTLVPSVLGVLNVTVSAEAEQSQTVCDNEIVSVPERGRIDTVTRSLLVQAEGTEKTESQSWLLCPQGNSVSEELELVLPEDVIEGSARASVSVLGDVLGRALKNIDGLLKMPYGCGEQNIAILSPNIYILQYLENTGQLTAAIRERATGFLKSGYQRQLNYKHVDGAYSTFGRGEGNTWLTAFVLRTFGKAQRYIFIDPQNIDSAKKWLQNKQRPDGCFIRQGRLFNNRMKGGVNDDVTMTAYITASLLELGHTLEDPVVSKGLSCLKPSIGNVTNTHATALLAYTFSLAGEHDAREQLLKKLDSVAISGDGRLHWSQSASDDSGSLAVEISSYVLLAVLTTAEVTAADLGYANRIVSWLVRQQNPYGGFSSTQDTVVALQALALYSTKVFSSDGSSTVTVKSDKESHHFDVNQDNKLLYQEKQLQEVPGKYSISAEGSTCASVQAALFYNIPTPTETSTLSIEAKTDGNCIKPSGYTLSINFTVTYNGELHSTNMVIVDIKILSGFTADASDLKNRLLVERVDSKDDHVIMYMKEVPRNSPMNYQLRLKQVLPVKNLKPAVIKVYDYYQTNFIMAVRGFLTPEGLLFACFLFFSVYGQTSGLHFMVTFPAVIESGSEATLCTSLLKPNETLQMTVYLVHDSQNRTLLQERVEEEFHRCSKFKAPQVEGQSVQEIRVEVKGESFEMMEKRKVMFKSYNPLTFIQTDKPIYNPGQTVNFRVVTLDADFVQLEQKYSILTLEDNKGNRISQWTNVSSPGLIVQLSHKLNPEAPEGQYKLEAKTGFRSITHHFKVKKYVLPRFEITVKTPVEQSVGEEELRIEVCAKYTYGQPVPGKALVQVCRKFNQYFHRDAAIISPCLVETVEMKENGCASPVFNMSHFISSEFEQHLKDSLDATVTVTEEGTDISMEKSKSMKVTYVIGKVEFLDLPKNFERDTVVEGKIKVSTFSGKPIPNKKVYLLDGRSWSPSLLQSLTTDVNGLASFLFNTSAHSKTEISLMASIYPDNQHRGYNKPFFTFSEARIALLQPATPYSPVYSELSIESLKEPIPCGSEISINIKYYIVGETAENYSTDIIYMVLSKGAIVHHGYEKVEVKESKKLIEGKVSFRLSVDVGLAPVVQVLVYCVLPSENVIATSKNFNVEKCLRNKVSLQFSPTEAVPGEENTLQLSAEPGSLCGLSAVDQSVFILEPGKRLNADEVFNLLPVKLVSDYVLEVEDEPKCYDYQIAEKHPVGSTLKSVGLKMATNMAIKGTKCVNTHYYYDALADLEWESATSNRPKDFDLVDSRMDSSKAETVRKFFPETWLWQLVKVGDSGSAQVPVTVPDTITTWEADAFCLSSIGLGVAPPAQLRVFQPFFLELSLPYSIIRGEEFELKATVFNYLSKCIMVKVTPAPSSHYALKASSDGEYSSCLCANGRKTFKWTLVPSVLGVLNVTVSAEAEQSQTVCDNEIVSVPERGRIDTVTRSLLVQAEGTEKSKSQNWLLCPQGNNVSEELELVVPEDVIEGSARASVSVLGDILGRALKNIDGLLKMPYGCGEQNIAILSPNIYILQYLENTGQLTAAIRERATGFLKSGYQRQLNYKHDDGAYSTFGSGEGNTWLTAFVLRTFGKAQRYIFIDPQNIDSAKKWLLSKQRPDGCFIRQGRLFNNRMKGGVNDDVTMTAYITASLLELGNTAKDPVVSRALSCLKTSTGDLTNTYATALLAYTFSLAGEHDAREQMLKKLDSVAISGDGRLHWSQSASDDSGSLAVEISSYVLLAVLTTAEVTAADLGYANRIVSWLVRQQNPYGGFSSTQDTVVALQALALYSIKVYSSDGSSTVTVQSADKESHHFDVNQDNKLLYQERPLQDVPGKYSISVKGSTCVSVQMALFYNIPIPAGRSTLNIKATTEGNCTKPFVQTLSIGFIVTYNGALQRTNMLKNSPLVERVDSQDDHVIMYIKEVPRNSPMTYQLRLKQVLPVKNLKPAVIKVYDYYQTSDQSEAEYSSPCG
ncbi:hypothetical protein AOLI_G00293320 [Acnodon oligacanthus]